jgi:lysyl-tRNA synthetase, class II
MPKQSERSPEPCRAIRRTHRHARLLGLAVAAAGVVSLFSALTPEFRDRLRFLHEALAPDTTHVAKGAAALLGVALLLLGRGIAHRRRLAYLGAVTLLVVCAVTHVVKGLDFEEAIVTLVVAGLLVRGRKLFTAPTPPARWRTLALAIPLVILIDFAYGLLGLGIRSNTAIGSFSIPLALRTVAARLVGMPGPLRLSGSFGRWFPATITILGVLSLLTIVLLALAPVAERTVGHHLTRQRERVRRLGDRPDGDTLDPFALRHDKQYVLSGDGEAAIAFRYVNGVGLAAGDPVGEPSSFDDAIARFLEHCAGHGWRAAFVGVRGDRLDLYERVGLRTHYLGDEAVIDVADFTLEGRRMRPVRQAYNRTKNFGLTTEVHREGELDPTLRRALVGIAERHRQGAPERGFSMALDELLSGRDSQCIIGVCRSPDGTPIAFQRYVPCKAGTGLSLDAMRRDAVGPNGVNERLIVEAIEWARGHGVAEVSLNFAAFKGLIEEGADLSPVQAAEAWVIRRLNPYFQIESLLTFNAKFQPRWVPRYLVYRSAGDLAPVGIAALSAEAFLPFDRRKADESDPDRELVAVGAGAPGAS